MLAAAIFYGFLFIALVVIPTVVLILLLVFFHHERAALSHAPRLSQLGSWAREQSLVRRLHGRAPRLTAFLVRRFEPRERLGLPATVATIVVVMGTWWFVRVLRAIHGKDPLVTADVRLHNSVPLFRSPGTTRAMVMLTQLGSPGFLAVLCIGIALLALWRGRPRVAATFLLGIVGADLVSVIVKVLVGHPRPIDPVVKAAAASFPSGHMLGSTVVYGLLASLLLAAPVRDSFRALGATLLMLLIVAVGISRVYLGVHWPSDLLGSLTLALVLLALLLFFMHYEAPLRMDQLRVPLPPRALLAAGIATLVIAAAAAPTLAGHTRFLSVHPAETARPIDSQALAQGLPADLARQSEDLLGGKMEPVSLVLIGAAPDLVARFARAGWRTADLPRPVRVLREGLAAVSNRPDPTGPATPAFLDERPQALTFEKPGDASGGIRKRHHTRAWLTAYCVTPGCVPVWLATASFDDGIEFSSRTHLPTHHIDPDIDAERELIAADLAKAGSSRLTVLPVMAPTSGHNAAGDTFHTDGRAVVLRVDNGPGSGVLASLSGPRQ